MSNFIRNVKRSIFLPPNREQRKALHKFRELVKALEQVSSLLQDKASAYFTLNDAGWWCD